MCWCFRVLVFSWALVCARAVAAAEGAPGDDPILNGLVEEALARNPTILAASASAEAARARPDQAAALPDPMFGVAYVNDGVSPSLGRQEMTTLSLMVTQALPGAGQQGRRADLA